MHPFFLSKNQLNSRGRRALEVLDGFARGVFEASDQLRVVSESNVGLRLEWSFGISGLSDTFSLAEAAAVIGRRITSALKALIVDLDVRIVSSREFWGRAASLVESVSKTMGSLYSAKLAGAAMSPKDLVRFAVGEALGFFVFSGERPPKWEGRACGL